VTKTCCVNVSTTGCTARTVPYALPHAIVAGRLARQRASALPERSFMMGGMRDGWYGSDMELKQWRR
jgi:hypothetical protein